MKSIIITLLSVLSFFSFAQEPVATATLSSKKQKGNFYFLWGYTRCKYSKSTIHFVDHSNKYYPETGRYHDYDFTIYDAQAK